MSDLSIHTLQELSQILRPPARLAALDIGTKTIGIALCSPDWEFVTPLTTITRTKWSNDLKALEKALAGYELSALIAGLPMNMDDTLGPRAQGVKQVVFNIIKANPEFLRGTAIAFCDERLSSTTAHDQTMHLSLKHAKSKGALDAMAAVDIMNRALQVLKTTF